MTSPSALQLLAGQLDRYRTLNEGRADPARYRAALDAGDIARLVDRLDRDGADVITTDIYRRVLALPGYLDQRALVHANEAARESSVHLRIQALTSYTAAEIDMQLLGLRGEPPAVIRPHMQQAWRLANSLAQAICDAETKLNARAA